jgi:hypothetical protein
MQTRGDAPPANREALDVFLAEYQWATGLLPFYRQIEVTVVGASALLVSAVASVVAVLEGGESADRSAEAALLSAAAWGPTLLLLLELMALTRIQRAAFYIRDYLAVPMRELAGREDLLRWEFIPARQLFFQDRKPRWRWPMVALTLSSAAVVFAIWAMSVALAAAGRFVHPNRAEADVLYLGYGAALVSTCLAVYGIYFTVVHEIRPNAHREVHQPTQDEQGKAPSERADDPPDG